MRPEATWHAAGLRTADRTTALVTLAIALAWASMIAMAWTRNVNWDEFYFLSHVHAHLDGRLDLALQTAFVHGFGWLKLVPGDELGQITAARLVMMGFFIATCGAIFRITQHLTNTRAALIAVLAFVTSGYAIPHGASFRADPMAAGFLMWALAIALTTPMRGRDVAAIAVLGALALLVTIKSGLYLPVLLAALIWRQDRAVLWRGLAAGMLALALAGTAFWCHQSGIAVAPGESASANVTEAASVTFGTGQLIPRAAELTLWLALSAGAVILALAGVRQAGNRRRALLLIAFAAPLLVALVYRNAFAYYFPFAVPPLMIAVAYGAQAVQGRALRLALTLMIASGTWQAWQAAGEGRAAQAATIAEVHRLFPEPVPYIDQNAMIASFPRHGFFMSTWGLATYRAAGQPVFADHIAANAPKFVLANRAELRAAMDPSVTDGPPGLLAADIATLRAHYIHYAGAIWLAGVEDVLMGAQTWSIPFAGDYRLHADGPVRIAGATYAPGDIITLPQGAVAVSSETQQDVRLIWNTAVQTPLVPLPETGLYAGFWRL